MPRSTQSLLSWGPTTSPSSTTTLNNTAASSSTSPPSTAPSTAPYQSTTTAGSSYAHTGSTLSRPQSGPLPGVGCWSAGTPFALQSLTRPPSAALLVTTPEELSASSLPTTMSSSTPGGFPYRWMANAGRAHHRAHMPVSPSGKGQRLLTRHNVAPLLPTSEELAMHSDASMPSPPSCLAASATTGASTPGSSTATATIGRSISEAATLMPASQGSLSSASSEEPTHSPPQTQPWQRCVRRNGMYYIEQVQRRCKAATSPPHAPPPQRHFSSSFAFPDACCSTCKDGASVMGSSRSTTLFHVSDCGTASLYANSAGMAGSPTGRWHWSDSSTTNTNGLQNSSPLNGTSSSGRHRTPFTSYTAVIGAAPRSPASMMSRAANNDSLTSANDSGTSGTAITADRSAAFPSQATTQAPSSPNSSHDQQPLPSHGPPRRRRSLATPPRADDSLSTSSTNPAGIGNAVDVGHTRHTYEQEPLVDPSVSLSDASELARSVPSTSPRRFEACSTAPTPVTDLSSAATVAGMGGGGGAALITSHQPVRSALATGRHHFNAHSLHFHDAVPATTPASASALAWSDVRDSGSASTTSQQQQQQQPPQQPPSVSNTSLSSLQAYNPHVSRSRHGSGSSPLSMRLNPAALTSYASQSNMAAPSSGIVTLIHTPNSPSPTTAHQHRSFSVVTAQLSNNTSAAAAGSGSGTTSPAPPLVFTALPEEPLTTAAAGAASEPMPQQAFEGVASPASPSSSTHASDWFVEQHLLRPSMPSHANALLYPSTMAAAAANGAGSPTFTNRSPSYFGITGLSAASSRITTPNATMAPLPTGFPAAASTIGGGGGGTASSSTQPQQPPQSQLLHRAGSSSLNASGTLMTSMAASAAAVSPVSATPTAWVTNAAVQPPPPPPPLPPFPPPLGDAPSPSPLLPPMLSDGVQLTPGLLSPPSAQQQQQQQKQRATTAAAKPANPVFASYPLAGFTGAAAGAKAMPTPAYDPSRSSTAAMASPNSDITLHHSPFHSSGGNGDGAVQSSVTGDRQSRTAAKAAAAAEALRLRDAGVLLVVPAGIAITSATVVSPSRFSWSVSDPPDAAIALMEHPTPPTSPETPTGGGENPKKTELVVTYFPVHKAVLRKHSAFFAALFGESSSPYVRSVPDEYIDLEALPNTSNVPADTAEAAAQAVESETNMEKAMKKAHYPGIKRQHCAAHLAAGKAEDAGEVTGGEDTSSDGALHSYVDSSEAAAASGKMAPCGTRVPAFYIRGLGCNSEIFPGEATTKEELEEEQAEAEDAPHLSATCMAQTLHYLYTGVLPLFHNNDDILSVSQQVAKPNAIPGFARQMAETFAMGLYCGLNSLTTALLNVLWRILALSYDVLPYWSIAVQWRLPEMQVLCEQWMSQHLGILLQTNTHLGMWRGLPMNQVELLMRLRGAALEELELQGQEADASSAREVSPYTAAAAASTAESENGSAGGGGAGSVDSGAAVAASNGSEARSGTTAEARPPRSSAPASPSFPMPPSLHQPSPGAPVMTPLATAPHTRGRDAEGATAAGAAAFSSSNTSVSTTSSPVPLVGLRETPSQPYPLVGTPPVLSGRLSIAENNTRVSTAVTRPADASGSSTNSSPARRLSSNVFPFPFSPMTGHADDTSIINSSGSSSSTTTPSGPVSLPVQSRRMGLMATSVPGGGAAAAAAAVSGEEASVPSSAVTPTLMPPPPSGWSTSPSASSGGFSHVLPSPALSHGAAAASSASTAVAPPMLPRPASEWASHPSTPATTPTTFAVPTRHFWSDNGRASGSAAVAAVSGTATTTAGRNTSSTSSTTAAAMLPSSTLIPTPASTPLTFAVMGEADEGSASSAAATSGTTTAATAAAAAAATPAGATTAGTSRTVVVQSPWRRGGASAWAEDDTDSLSRSLSDTLFSRSPAASVNNNVYYPPVTAAQRNSSSLHFPPSPTTGMVGSFSSPFSNAHGTTSSAGSAAVRTPADYASHTIGLHNHPLRAGRDTRDRSPARGPSSRTAATASSPFTSAASWMVVPPTLQLLADGAWRIGGYGRLYTIEHREALEKRQSYWFHAEQEQHRDRDSLEKALLPEEEVLQRLWTWWTAHVEARRDLKVKVPLEETAAMASMLRTIRMREVEAAGAASSATEKGGSDLAAVLEEARAFLQQRVECVDAADSFALPPAPSD